MAQIKLNKKNFFHNLDIIAAQTKSVEKIALVLKDNAYGHGVKEVASMAKEYGIEKVVVRNEQEAREVFELFEYILVLADIPLNADSKIRYTINDINSIKKFPKNTLVELKVNTGMNRNGIGMDELELAFKLIKENSLVLEAIFTHHASADEFDGVYELQEKNFEAIKKSTSLLYPSLRFHSCNSAALFRTKDFSEDMARVGIAAYGCLELPKIINIVEQNPVLSLYANKISSRVLTPKSKLGYGGSFEAKKEIVVTNYDIGYGDGFMRILSNNYQTPEGVKLLGRISMDNSSFESNAEELLIFSNAREVASRAQTISYEILTSLKANIKRQIV